MTKKTLLILFMAALLIPVMLTACNQTTSTGTSTVEMTEETNLIVGTIKLDGTDQAVNIDQAAQLIPLWQMLQSLETSGTAATAETDAVIKQIKAIMTTDQISTIDAMNLTQEDVMSAMGNMGMAPGINASGTPDASAAGFPDPGMAGGVPGDMGTTGGVPSAGSGERPSGGMTGGVPGAGGPGGTDGGIASGLSSEQIATFEAQQSSSGTVPSMNNSSRMIEALVAYLRAIK
jgi:hypothetical protein